MRGWILQVYPFIHAFPKFLAEGLIKVEDDYSRSFLIDNIRVEKRHAEHWIWIDSDSADLPGNAGCGRRQQAGAARRQSLTD